MCVYSHCFYHRKNISYTEHKYNHKGKTDKIDFIRVKRLIKWTSLEWTLLIC